MAKVKITGVKQQYKPVTVRQKFYMDSGIKPSSTPTVTQAPTGRLTSPQKKFVAPCRRCPGSA